MSNRLVFMRCPDLNLFENSLVCKHHQSPKVYIYRRRHIFKVLRLYAISKTFLVATMSSSVTTPIFQSAYLQKKTYFLSVKILPNIQNLLGCNNVFFCKHTNLPKRVFTEEDLFSKCSDDTNLSKLSWLQQCPFL